MIAGDENSGPGSTLISRVFVIIVILCLVVSGQASAADSESLEYQIKAAFLLNFGKFIEWPASGRDAGKPFTFCVLGSDPFGPVLENTIAGKSLGSRQTQIRRIKTPSEAKNCQVVFIASSERSRVHQLLQVFSAEPVLTVSEIPGFAENGGIINFVLKNDRVQFEINSYRAEKVGLHISSHLLRLAIVVGTPQNAGR